MSPRLFHPLHPLRPADFRWQLAIYLADETKQPFHRHDDRFLTIARRFLRLQDSHGSHEFLVATKLPYMQAAYHIFHPYPVALHLTAPRHLPTATWNRDILEPQWHSPLSIRALKQQKRARANPVNPTSRRTLRRC